MSSKTQTSDNDNQQKQLMIEKHAKYFTRFLNLLPARLATHDSTRVTIAFFAVCGLDVLNSMDQLSDTKKQNVIDWIYRLQVVPQNKNNTVGAQQPPVACGGLQGGSALNLKNDNENYCTNNYKWGHLAMTYTGIAILVTLGDDLSRLDRKAIIEGVAAVQLPDGSFSASIEGHEHDMRFVYCAAAICAMLNDWGTVNKEAMAQYIKNSIRYDYGISQHYEMESHGGTTFCAIAALDLSGQLNTLTYATIERIKRWLVFRQEDGFNGRPNKPVDTCYSFWIGASLKILNAFHLTNFDDNRSYLLDAQDNVVGGFSKWTHSTTDPFHTYFTLCGLSFIEEPGLQSIMPSLNITERAYDKLKTIHKLWQLTDTIRDVRLLIE